MSHSICLCSFAVINRLYFAALNYLNKCNILHDLAYTQSDRSHTRLYSKSEVLADNIESIQLLNQMHADT